MSKNSKIKRDKKKTAERKKDLAAAATRIDLDNPIIVRREILKLFNPVLLTTPREINDDIISFCSTVSDAVPVYISAEPEAWSRQGCCDMNVKEYIALHGGEVVCGYRIWYNEPRYIEAERHAIWRNKDVHKDVSFSPDGEQRFLFIADRPDRQASLDDNLRRIRWGKDYETRKLIGIQEDMESRLNIGRMTDEQAWNTMPSYADWQSGKRMPALVPISASGHNLIK